MLRTVREFRCTAAPDARPQKHVASAINLRRALAIPRKQPRLVMAAAPRAAAETETAAAAAPAGKACIFQALGG